MNNEQYLLSIENTILSMLIYSENEREFIFSALKEDSFFYPLNRKIFKTLLYLFEKGLPVTEELILRESPEKSKEAIDRALTELIATNPVSNIVAYIEILKEARYKKDIEFFLKDSLRALQEGGEEFATVMGKIYEGAEKLKKQNSTELFEICSIENIEAKDSEFYLKGFLPIPKNTVTMFSAPGGSGKSYLLLQIAIRFLLENPNKKAFLWFSEDPKELSKSRSENIVEKLLSSSMEKISGRLKISDSQTVQVLEGKGRESIINPHFYTLKAMLKEFELIVLDPLIAFYGADENSNADARKFMQLFTHWAANEEKSIIFIHHSTKNSTQSRGASAFVDAVRLVYEIDKIKNKEGQEIDTQKRKIKITKDNYGAALLLGGYEVEREVFVDKKRESEKIIEFIPKSGESFFIKDDDF